MQVVTSENFQQLVETGKVPEFVPPKADAKVEIVVEPAKDTKTEEQPRGDDGKFIKTDETKPDVAAKAADESDDPDDADLPERVRKQIGKKHRAMREAEEFARQLYGDKTAAEQRAEKAEAALKALQDSKSGPAPVEDAKAPKAEDFKTVGEYAEALAEYKVEKKFAERDAQREREAQERAAAKAQDEFNRHIQKVSKEIPDYAEVIAASDIDMPPHITVYLASSGEMGVRLGYYLAKHPDDFDRINAMPPVRALAELGKLEDRVTKKPEGEKPAATTTVSRAPSPITPIEGNAAPVTKDPAKMTLQELRAYENERRIKARR